ncbi:uncharacterized protein LOC115358673 [Myripristis murdjan]|uniref:uncharacterized protein LOC115358673 n=1 Tax=Myripristis murdjan TaxID=586833 RepID=UPI001176400D|nr:uncharacterized protein LOC115358673 [Myripristis murdjan]
MPPKRGAVAPSTQPPVKMIKIGSEIQDFGCDSGEDKFRFSEAPSYSPLQEGEPADFEEESIASPGIRTDTISLLMKIEQLQAQLKYERRCRILAERELRELKEMNTLMMQMRHTAHELRVTLDHVRQGGDAAVAQHNAEDEAISFLSEPEGEMRMLHQVPEEDDNYLYLSEGLRVPKNLYERISEITDFKKYTSALLMMLFDRETLATHSLQGRRTNVTGEDCQKPQLPPDILRSIIDHVGIKFGVDNSQIKTAIRTKLNNEDKLLKKRLGLGRAEPRVVVDQSSCQDAAMLTENVVVKNDECHL